MTDTENDIAAVKTAADLRLEEIESRLQALETENTELRKANADLYAFAKQRSEVPAESAKKEPSMSVIDEDPLPAMDYDRMERDVLAMWHLSKE